MRTIDVIIESITSYIESKNSKVNARQEGQPIKDVVIDAPSQEFGLAYVAEDYVSALASISLLRTVLGSATYQTQLQDALNMTADQVTAELKRAVDDLANNVDITRDPATFATGTIRLYRTTTGTVHISIGTTVITTGTNPIVFVTTSDISGATTYDSVTGLYYIDGGIQAQVAGSSGVVPAGTIQTIFPTLVDVTSCNNLAATFGGYNEETNDSVLDRVEKKWKGRNLNTDAGYYEFVKAIAGISDVLVVDSTSPLMLRAETGVDIHILGSDLIATVDTINYVGVDVILQKQPARSISSVVGSIHGAFTPVTEYTFVEDFGGFANSIYGQDKIQFILAPTIGETLTISYVYDGKPEEIQDMLTVTYQSGINHVVDTDILIKAGEQVLIDMQIQLTALPGYTLATVKSNVSIAITNYLNTLTLGVDAEQGKVIDIIEEVPGVGVLTIPLAQFHKAGGAGSISVISIDPNEYARAGAITYL